MATATNRGAIAPPDKNPAGTAMRKCISLLNELDDDQRDRVVRAMMSLYGLPDFAVGVSSTLEPADSRAREGVLGG